MRTGTERTEERRVQTNLKEFQDEGNELCETLAHGHSKIKWGQIADYIRRDFPIHYEQLVSDVDEEGFVTVGAKGGNFFDYWAQCKDIQNREKFQRLYESEAPKINAQPSRKLRDLVLCSDIWSFSRSERKALIQFWEQSIRQDWIDKLVALAQDHRDAANVLDTLNSEYSRRILETADVIGLTTTGLARNGSLLHRVNSKTLICEEAGEVLEVSPLVVLNNL